MIHLSMDNGHVDLTSGECPRQWQMICHYLDSYGVGRCVDVYVTSECILICILYIVTRCLFRDVSIMYLSHIVLPDVPIGRIINVNKSCQVIR